MAAEAGLREAASPTAMLASVCDPRAWMSSQEALGLASWIVLDTLTVAAAAVALEADMQAAIRTTLAGESAPGPCVAPGTSGGLAPGPAAGITASAAHGIDYDDTYRADRVSAHLSVTVVAGALAVGQSAGATGWRFLDAVAAGVEASARLGFAVAPALVQRWHPTAVLGSVGAAAAAARLLGLDGARAEQAIGLAADRAAGSRSCLDGADATKPLHAGLAAMEGVRAARMVAQGVPGPLGYLEKPMGFADTYVEGRWEPSRLTGGDEPLILRTSTKFFPVMHALHAAVLAALAIARERGGVDEADIATVLVRQPSERRTDAALWDVASPMSARLSLPYAVGVTLLDGACGLAQFRPARVAAADIQALLPRIRLEGSDELQSRFGTRLSSIVEVTLRDGTKVERLEVDALGGPEKPATEEDRLRKALDLIAESPDPGAGAGLIEAARGLYDAPTLDPLATAFASLSRWPT